MVVSRYGVSLRLLEHKDIEMVRQWRNSKWVNQFMEYREYITPEMQEEWFRKVNSPEYLYMIAEYKGEAIGLMNDKNINWEEKTSESGFFLKDQSYYHTHIPMLVSLCGIDATFFFLRWNKSYARMLRTNQNVIDFNKALGYELCDGQENVENQLYVMTRERFLKKSPKIRKAALVVAGAEDRMELIVTPHDLELGIGRKFIDGLKNSGIPFEVKESGLGTHYKVTEQLRWG